MLLVGSYTYLHTQPIKRYYENYITEISATFIDIELTPHFNCNGSNIKLTRKSLVKHFQNHYSWNLPNKRCGGSRKKGTSCVAKKLDKEVHSDIMEQEWIHHIRNSSY